MRPYAEVIGDPIAQSKSPAIHGFWAGALGLEADYRAAHVRAEGLADYLAARRADPLWRGCNVTMPHKQAILALLDGCDPLAARIGAVNTVVPAGDGRLLGYNTDLPGFVEPLGERRFAHAVVVGAGGAARAVLLGLAQDGRAGQITVLNRNVGRAQALLEEFDIAGAALGLDAPLAGADLLVNTSALGMVGHPPLQLDLAALAPGAVVYDIVTAPPLTPLLADAAARGLATIDGLSMLIGQADYAFRHFFGARPPRADGDGALRARLAA